MRLLRDHVKLNCPVGAGHARDGTRSRAWPAPTKPIYQRGYQPVRNGFTLIEMLVGVALVALLATLALPLQELTVKRGQEAELRANLRQIREALDSYKLATMNGNIAVAPGESGYPKSLKQLVTGVKDVRSPTGLPIYFLRRIPGDPFADRTLSPEESWGLRSYLSPHDQPRAGDDVFDVYSLSEGVGMNGIPYRQW